MARYYRGKTTLDPETRIMLAEEMKKAITSLAPDKQLEALEKFETNLTDTLFGFVESAAHDLHAESKKNIRKSVKLNEQDKKNFEKRLYKNHRDLFRKVDEIMGISVDAVTEHRKMMNDQVGDKDQIYPFLIRLHAMIIMNAHEIVALSRSGYGMAANARWRSMHETNVLLQYMRVRGSRAYKLFRDHDAVTRYKSMLSYNQHAIALGNKPFSSKEIRLAKKKYDRRLNKYGESFKKDYGWLAADSNGRLNHFRDMEEFVQVDHLRPYYRFTSLDIHTTWSSLTSGVVYDSLVTKNIILIGPADHGFEDAIDLAVNTLVHATVSIMTYNTSFNGLIYAKVLMNLQAEEQHLLENVIKYKRDKYGLFPDANLAIDQLTNSN